MGKKALVLLALLPLLAMGGRQQGMGPGPGMPASSGGGSISPVGTPTCVYSMTSPISVPYTKHAAGDALVVSISENAAADYDTVTVTDGGSTYTEVVSTPVSTNYHVDLFGTLSLASSSGNLSVTVYQLTAAAVCVQEFSGVVEWGNTLATNTSSGSSSYSGSIMMHNESGNYAVAGVGNWIGTTTWTATSGTLYGQTYGTQSAGMITGIAGTAGSSMTLAGTASASHSWGMPLLELRAH
jgi:hypothetical protein